MAKRFINITREKIKKLSSEIPSGKYVKWQANEIPGTDKIKVNLQISNQFYLVKSSKTPNEDLSTGILTSLEILERLSQILKEQLNPKTEEKQCSF